jgi:hypothetical protein
VRERGYVLDYIRTCTRTHPLIDSIAMNGMASFLLIQTQA